MSLRLKLSLLAAGLLVLGLGLGLAVTYSALVRLRLLDLDTDNRLVAELIVETLLANPNGAVPASLERYLIRDSGVSTAQIYRGSERVWEGGVLDAPVPLDPQGLLSGAGVDSVGFWRVYTHTQNGLTVQVGRPMTALHAILRPYAAITLPLLLVLSLLCGGSVYLLVGWALRPLHTLTQATRRFDAGGSVPALSGNDEAATLAKAFAALLERLRGERERERHFLAYAAHELRTPLSALRATLEAAQLRGEPLGLDFVRRLYREAQRLERFAQNLLALSRAEAGEVRAERLDLADIAALAYDRFQPLALERGFELHLNAEPASAFADPRLLEQALNNLVINAIHHTPKGDILIGSGVADEAVFLEVADGGPGPGTNVQEGLGLRVVRSVAEAHGGSFTFEKHSGTKACLKFKPAPDLLLG